MAEKLILGGIVIEVAYKQVKQLRMMVYPPDGRVRISAPVNAGSEAVRDFALSKLSWIEKHRALFRSRARTGGTEDDTVRYVWGKALPLEVVRRRGYRKIALKEGRIHLSVPPDCGAAKKQELLDTWYRRLLDAAAPELIRKWAAAIGVEVRGFYTRKMKSHWGSCNYGKKTIRLNTELAKRSPECLEYVIVHELVHLIETSHNRNFYRLMDAFLPGWKEIRKKLNSGEP
ncbi:MAG: M48 family metallopeptidase [Treponema sp.]|jgi:predicted metal-dependent hydrolase|nr:M48 family metallopeptidase [Treponema sp.]